MRYALGLDVGQAVDYAAVAIAEYDEQAPRGETVYAIRYLWRWPLLTPYHTLVQDTANLVAHAPRGSLDLVLDATGIGRSVYEQFVLARLNPIPVTLHGGQQVTWDKGYWRVPKRDVVAAVQVTIQSSRLRIARELELAPVLQRELLDFRCTIDPATAHDSYAAWREKDKDHDDLVLAVAVALWWAEREAAARPPSVDMRRGLIAKRGGMHLYRERSWQDPGPDTGWSAADQQDWDAAKEAHARGELPTQPVQPERRT